MSPGTRRELLGPSDEELLLLEQGTHPSQLGRDEGSTTRASTASVPTDAGEAATTRAPTASIPTGGETSTTGTASASIPTDGGETSTTGTSSIPTASIPTGGETSTTGTASIPSTTRQDPDTQTTAAVLTDLQVISIPQKPVVATLPKLKADLKNKSWDKITIPKSVSLMKKGSQPKTQAVNAITKGQDYVKEWAEFATELEEKASTAIKVYENGITAGWKTITDQNRAIIALNKEVRVSNNKANTLNATIKDLKRDVSDSQNKLTDAEKIIKQLRTELKTAKGELDKLRNSAATGGGNKASGSLTGTFAEKLAYQKASNELKLKHEADKQKQQDKSKRRNEKHRFHMRSSMMAGLQDGSFRSYLGGAADGDSGGYLQRLGVS
jgi:hypothetical protein